MILEGRMEETNKSWLKIRYETDVMRGVQMGGNELINSFPVEEMRKCQYAI